METNFKPTKNTYVCSRHFKRENFTSQATGKIVLKSLTIPSIFPWNKSAVLGSKNNSPTQSKASTPAPSTAEKKPEVKEEEVKVEAKEEKSVIQIEPVKVEPEEKPAVTVKVKANDSSKKKAPTISKSPDKPKKSSKRLSAKVVATPKVKTEIPATPEQVKASPAVQTPKKKNQVVNFVPGSSIEAQNFDGKWMPVKVIEVDMEEREVLVRSCDKNNKSKTG